MKSINDLVAEGVHAANIKVWNDNIKTQYPLVYWDHELQCISKVTPIKEL